MALNGSSTTKAVSFSTDQAPIPLTKPLRRIVIMVQNTEGIFGNGSLGLLGLGRSSGNDSYLSGVLKSRGWNSVLLGLAVNPYNSTANATTEQLGGSLNFQELNSNLYSGEVSWQPTAKVTNAPANIPTDWALQFDSYQMSFGSRTTFSSGGGATIDPFFPEFMIPGSEATDFCSSIFLRDPTVY